jgi:hypothetical protein
MKLGNLFNLALLGIGLSVAGYATYHLMKKKKKTVSFGAVEIFEFRRDEQDFDAEEESGEIDEAWQDLLDDCF